MNAEIRCQRAEEVGYDIRDVWVDPSEAVEGTSQTTLEGVNDRVTELAAVQEQDIQDIYAVIEDTQERQTQIYQMVDILAEDRQFHYNTARLLDQEALDYRIALQESLVATLIAHVSSLQGQLSVALGQIQTLQARDQAHADDHKGAADMTATLKAVLFEQTKSKQECPQRLLITKFFKISLMVMATVATILTLELEELYALCVSNQVKFATCTFLGNALTWWNSHMKAVTQDVAYAMEWKTLKKVMTDKYCPRGEIKKLKNGNHGNHGNQCGNGNAPAKVYVVGNAGTNPDSNVVTGTFLLNDRYASILFDIGADRSFVSTTFSSLIDITPTTLDHYYDVELADGKIIGINTIIRGCTLNFLDHPFNINLMPVELGSFDVIIGMDWLSKYHALIDCAEKVVRIP
ncbi:putative reverse transcriptase domain-containing protein [Tanacetum coccineum]